MTRAIDVLMKFVRGLSTQTEYPLPDEVKAAANAAITHAVALRSEVSIVYIGTEIDHSNPKVSETKYFGSKEAVVAWVKLGKLDEDGNNARSYRTDSLLF